MADERGPMLRKEVQERVLEVLRGLEVYLVGGCVRDHLLGRDPVDLDLVVVGSDPEDMLGRGFTVHGLEHSVFIHRDPLLVGIEFSLARLEVKVGAGHQGFAFEYRGVTLEDDLCRRDLTVNALAMPVADAGTLHDPFGGRRDLEAGCLRHVSDAFSEDPLRVLRVARFSARFGWDVAGETEELCRKLAHSGGLDELTPERVGREVLQALGEPSPHRFLRFLHRVGALERVLPELDLYGIPQPAEHHPEVDTGVHLELTLQRVSELTDDPLTRFGALVHDVGKKLSPPEELPRHVDHEGRGAPVARALARRLGLSRAFMEFGEAASELHLRVHRLAEMKPGKVVKLLSRLDRRGQLLENARRLGHVAMADARGRTGREERAYPQAARLLAAAEAYLSVAPRADLVEELERTPRKERRSLVERVKSCLAQDRAEAIRALGTDGQVQW